MLTDKQIDQLFELWESRIAYLKDYAFTTAEEQAKMYGHACCYEQAILDVDNTINDIWGNFKIEMK